MNSIVLIGRLVRDPEQRVTQSGISVTTFTLAVDRDYKDASGNRPADFIDIVAWRQLAELCGKYLKKGNKAGIRGSLQTRTYETQDGSKRKVSEVLADGVEFLTPKSASAAPAPEPVPPPAAAPSGPMYEEDDLPF